MIGTLSAVAGLNGTLSAIGTLSADLSSPPYAEDYSGSYAVTPTREAQTVEVAGKRMTQDLTVGAIPEGLIDTTIASGAAAAADIATGKQAYANGSIITGTADLWNPLGADAELIATYDMGTTALSATSFNGWTPSTTAKTIKASTNLGTITSPSLDLYEYAIKTVFESNTAYTSGTTLVAAVVRQLCEIVQIIHRKPSSFANMASGTDNYNYCGTFYTAPWMRYYDTSGAEKMAWTGSYGIYPTATAATFGSTTGENTTITIKAPAYTARCYKSYFKEAMASAVDQANSTIKCKVYVYRYKRTKSTLWQMYHECVDVYNA